MNRLVAVLAVALSAALPAASQVLYGTLTGIVEDCRRRGCAKSLPSK